MSAKSAASAAAAAAGAIDLNACAERQVDSDDAVRAENAAKRRRAFPICEVSYICCRACLLGCWFSSV